MSYIPISTLCLYRSDLAFVGRRTAGGGVGVRLGFPTSLPSLLMSRQQVHRILVGLLGGTIGFASPKNVVALSIRPVLSISPASGPFLRVTVRSAKVNVTATSVRGLFGPFIRVSDTLGHRCGKAKLNLTLIGHVMRLRNKRMNMADEIKINDYFALSLPYTTCKFSQLRPPS